MSTTITSTPEKEINSNPLTVSKWNAVHHPIKFGMKREDISAAFSFPIVDEVLITIAPFADPTEGLEIGDVLYLGTNGFGGGQATIISVTPAAGEIVVDQTKDPVTALSGYINLISGRANFFIETSIYDKSSGVNVFVQKVISKPNESGELEVDVSSFLKSLVGYIDEYDYSIINNFQDLNLGGIFNIEYQEFWIGGNGANNVPGIDYYFTNSSKQIGDLYGSNMGEYVTFNDFTIGEPAKFMTDFNKPTIFPNFPMSLVFIHSEEMVNTGDTIAYKDYFDVNGGLISTDSDGLNTGQKPFVNRLTVDTVGINGDSVDYYIDNDGVEVTERKRMFIDNECKDFPIYLTWINSVGGYDYWLFFKTNKEKLTTKLENPYLKNVDDLETDLGNIEITGKTNSPQIDFGARVRAESMDGMASLFASPKVLWLTNPDTWQTDGPKWRRVIIKNGSLPKEESRKAFMEVKMSMLLPIRNTQKE